MTTYLINFLVYSMAMVGLLFICLMVYKKTMVNPKCSKNTNNLVIENALNLSSRKTLYVVKAGEEKFLIASDVDRTTFLAKLDGNIAGENFTKSITQTPSDLVTIDVQQQIKRPRNAVGKRQGNIPIYKTDVQDKVFVNKENTVLEVEKDIKPKLHNVNFSQVVQEVSNNQEYTEVKDINSQINKGVDYTEIMQVLESDNAKKPVMKEILRKLEEKPQTVSKYSVYGDAAVVHQE